MKNKHVIFKNNIFTDQVNLLCVNKPGDVESFFSAIEDFLSKGFYVAGYFNYEFGYLLEERFSKFYNLETQKHFACFGVFKTMKPIEFPKVPKQVTPEIIEKIDFKRYSQDVARIKDYLDAGDVYQVNYTFKLALNLNDPWQTFLKLQQAQAVPYSAFVNLQDNEYILSFSPELFFKKEKNHITMQPMKGTIARGKNCKEDAQKISTISKDPKSQSENIMIVELLRNDISRICKHGSVKVESLFDIEKYETLFQMTSKIQGELKDNVRYKDIFKAIFPCGSVTGAPKIRAMEIIRQLEKENRGVYTGAIGYFAPDNSACFNVAIRTIEAQGEKAHMGIGSGIVVDSDIKQEYEECLLKAQFVSKNVQDFKLIETMRWNKRYFLLRMHLARLKESAEYFGFVFKKSKILNVLYQKAKEFKHDKVYRVRLLLDSMGKVSIEAKEIVLKKREDLKIAVAKEHVNSKDVFLYHKTTNRNFYDEAYKKCQEQGLADIIFTNELGEITEGCISNIVIKKNGIYYTPPVSCGLLAGVYRQNLLDKKKVVEKKLYIQDLHEADKIFLCNSVRGMRCVFYF